MSVGVKGELYIGGSLARGYYNDLDLTKENGFKPVTEVNDLMAFYPAEEYHQDYYERKAIEPYCHYRVKRF